MPHASSDMEIPARTTCAKLPIYSQNTIRMTHKECVSDDIAYSFCHLYTSSIKCTYRYDDYRETDVSNTFEFPWNFHLSEMQYA